MRLHNTLSRKTEDFVPIKKGKVSMYHCGPTVYNYAHIGNLRAYVFADTLRRAFEFVGYKTKQVINITDVGHLVGDGDYGEDKMEKEAKKVKKTATEIAEFYTQAFFTDLKKLNAKTDGTSFPKASDHIPEQISLIQVLEKKGFTYKTSDGIYFDTSLFANYGKLGNINLSELEEGARVAKNPEKRNPTDFALWKFSPKSEGGEKRQQEWPSPWGVGFPGWHIECSAMSMKYLGETFDIHTGGIDHIPVHHNNEMAQSECATGKPYAHVWLHNAHLNSTEGKMAKSAGNFVRLETLENEHIHPLAYRYWLLTSHYRTPIILSFDAIRAAQTALESVVHKISLAGLIGLEGAVKNENNKDNKNGWLKNFIEKIAGNNKNENTNNVRVTEIKKSLANFIENDLDTPSCIALLHKITDNFGSGTFSDQEIKKIIADFDAVLGLNLAKLVAYSTEVQENIKKLSKERDGFRAKNNWAESDRIRKEIENMGFILEDTSTGSKIRRPLSSLPTVL